MTFAEDIHIIVRENIILNKTTEIIYSPGYSNVYLFCSVIISILWGDVRLEVPGYFTSDAFCSLGCF